MARAGTPFVAPKSEEEATLFAQSYPVDRGLDSPKMLSAACMRKGEQTGWAVTAVAEAADLPQLRRRTCLIRYSNSCVRRQACFGDGLGDSFQNTCRADRRSRFADPRLRGSL